MILHLIGMALFGLIVGAIARLIYPGRQSIGILGTMLLGIAGSLLGGGLGWLMFGEFEAAGWIFSIICALLLVWLGETFGGRAERGTLRR